MAQRHVRLTFTRNSLAEYGAILGLCIAVGLEVWRQSALASVSGEAQEGVWLLAFLIGVVLGAPLNFLALILAEPLTAMAVKLGIDPFAGIDPFYGVLVGIVINWTWLGWVASSRRRNAAAETPPADASGGSQSATS